MDLQSIAVNGQLLPIDQSVFATSSNRGTIIDSGTTLAYLIEEAYDPLVEAVSLILFTTRVVVDTSPFLPEVIDVLLELRSWLVTE